VAFAVVGPSSSIGIKLPDSDVGARDGDGDSELIVGIVDVGRFDPSAPSSGFLFDYVPGLEVSNIMDLPVVMPVSIIVSESVGQPGLIVPV